MTAVASSTLRWFTLPTLTAVAALSMMACTAGSDDEATESAGEVVSEPVETAESAESPESTPTTDAASTEATTSATTERATGAAPEAYIASFDPDGGSDLYRLVGDDVEPVTALSFSGGPVQLTDLALSAEGVLYGSTFDQLVRIDTASGDVELVAPFGQRPVNALTFLPDGRLVAADLEGRVSVVDVETGEAETLATYPAGLVSSGDLAVAAGGELLATATDTVDEYLLAIDLDTGEVEIRSATLPAAVYGLVVTPDGKLLAFTFVSASERCDGGELIDITADGAAYEPLRCLDFLPGGAAGS